MPTTKKMTRPQQWAMYTVSARAALDTLSDAKEQFESAMENLASMKDEYEETLGNMPENLQQTAYGEKLQAIVDIDFEVEIDLSDAEAAVDNAEGAELPLGFGRD